MAYWIMGYQVLKFSGWSVVMIYNFVYPRASRSRLEEVKRYSA